MAKQAGPIFFTGTIDDLIFYKLGDQYYVRRKGEPTSTTKKKLKDKNSYPLLNRRKQEFGEASQLARAIYYQLPGKLRGHGIQQKLTGKVVRLMRKGMKEGEIEAFLLQQLLGATPTPDQPVPAKPKDTTTGKEKRQPAPAHPRQQPTVKTATTPQLSDWKIDANGRLYKEAVKQQHSSYTGCNGQPLSAIRKCCHPCSFQGIMPRIWNARTG